MIAASINGVIHSIFFHKHLRNVWVKNVLDYLTEFLRSYLNDSLDEVASELHASPGLMSLAHAFDKMSSLCANYPMGLGKVFRQ